MFGVGDELMIDQSEVNEDEADLRRDWRFPAYERMCGRLFHRTTCKGMRGILTSGEIRPNDGSFPFSFKISQTSYGFQNGYICLFDFEGTSAADQIQTFVIWDNLIGQIGKTFFLLPLDSTELRSHLISSGLAPQPSQQNYGGCMRPIECWYPRPIALDLVTHIVVVCYTGPQPEIVNYQKSEISDGLASFCP